MEQARFLGTPRGSAGIIVQTHKGTSLENYVASEASVQCRKRFEVLCSTHGKNWERRKDACGRYNCAGMIWACRRTALPNPEEWKLILDEDDYRPLRENELCVIGDIVVYFDAGSSEILHIARICQLKQLHDANGNKLGTPIPLALSKWDASSGECIHAIPDVFLNGGEVFNVIIYTDRH